MFKVSGKNGIGALKNLLKIFLFFIITTTVVLADRATKVFFSDLLNLGESIPIIHNILHFTLVHNTGIAFGLFKDHGIVFIIIPITLIGLLVFNIYFNHHDQDLTLSYIIAFALILGGAIGNLIDRIFIGHVIDFIDFRIWPVFNLADSAITVGAGLLMWKSWQSGWFNRK